jgi:hypothetical protein
MLKPAMKRIVIDCQDAQHTQVKKIAQRRGITISNLFRELIGWPAERQGERKDLKKKSR